MFSEGSHGLLCPECMKEFSDVNALTDHFETIHVNSGQNVVPQKSPVESVPDSFIENNLPQNSSNMTKSTNIAKEMYVDKDNSIRENTPKQQQKIAKKFNSFSSFLNNITQKLGPQDTNNSISGNKKVERVNSFKEKLKEKNRKISELKEKCKELESISVLSDKENQISVNFLLHVLYAEIVELYAASSVSKRYFHSAQVPAYEEAGTFECKFDQEKLRKEDFDELKEEEADNTTNFSDEYKDDYSQNGTKIFTADGSIDASNKETSHNLQNLVQENKVLIEKLSQYEEITKKKSAKISNLVEKYNSLRSSFTEEVKILENAKKNLEKEVMELKCDKKVATNEIKNMKKEIKAGQKNIEEISSDMASKNAALSKTNQNMKSRINQLNEHIFTISESQKAVELEKEKLLEIKEDQSKKIAKLEENVDELTKKYNKALFKIENLEDNISNTCKQKDVLYKQNEKLEANKKQIKFEFENKVKSIEETNLTLKTNYEYVSSQFTTLKKTNSQLKLNYQNVKDKYDCLVYDQKASELKYDEVVKTNKLLQNQSNQIEQKKNEDGEKILLLQMNLDKLEHINRENSLALCEMDREVRSAKNKIRDMCCRSWQPDNTSSNCSDCNKQFSVVFLRRHHCRNCGKLICEECASNLHMLPCSPTKEKVCLDCHKELTFYRNL